MNPDDQNQSTELPISLFDYDLPEELIAQEPLADRTASRLLVLDRATGDCVHTHFADIDQWLRPGDLLVVNDTRVFPARLMAQRETGGRIELLLVQDLGDDVWLAMARPSRRLKPGEALRILQSDESNTGYSATMVDKQDDGMIRIELPDALEVLDTAGQVPLPGYIHRPLAEVDRYQTVYARETGSVAAPTAGLHFTDAKMDELSSMGVEIASVTLHVGPGTFQPVKVEDARQHMMHAERFVVEEPALESLRRARDEGRRIIAVGTTSCRTLEAIAEKLDEPGPVSGATALYITPGFRFQLVDGLITNFHLPRSTLLLLVSALAGRESVLRAYEEAIAHRYRFFSFGDAMLIL